MKRALGVFLFLCIVAPVFAVEATPDKIIVTWNRRPVPKKVIAEALLLKVVDKDGKGLPNVNLKVSAFRGGATFFLPAEGSAKAAATLPVTTNSEGEVLLGVVSGDEGLLQANAAVVDAAGKETLSTPVDSNSGMTEKCDAYNDCRDTTNLSFYTGVVIDSFASQAYNDMFNKGVTSGTKSSPVFGIDFQHRFLDNASGKWWVYGETLHSSRTLEVQCSAGKPADKTPAVAPAADEPTTENPCSTDTKTPDNDNDYTALLRGASSTEAFMGMRWEPKMLLTENSTFYVKGQLGFLTLAGAGGDVIDNHHFGVGIMLTNGRLRDSYLEIGHGRTDLFKEHRTNRWKIDGYVSWDLIAGAGERSFVSPFLQMCVDSDFKKGADSVQIYAGMNISLDAMKITIGSK